MPYQTGLPAALRGRGLTVELVPGWETRGSSAFNPRGSVSHWTAGPATGDRPSLNVCVKGRPDLPGPLCNVFLTRAGVAVVVAAGRANHAGAGGWKGLTGNASVWGTEAENSGRGEWTAAQRWAYPLINAAYADLSGFDASMVCGHNEWAPTRKIDIHDYTMVGMRAQVASLLAGRGLTEAQVRTLQRHVGATVDGIWGENTTRAVQAWLGVRVDGAMGPVTITALQHRVGAPVDGVWGPQSAATLGRYLDIVAAPKPAPAPQPEPVAPEEEPMPTAREIADTLLDTPLYPDWGNTGTVRAALTALLDLRDVPTKDGAVRLDVAVGRILDAAPGADVDPVSERLTAV